MTDMGQAPAHLMQSNRARVLQDVTAGLGATRPAHISIRGGKFRLVNAAGAEFLVPTHHLDVIIIGAQYNASRVYYGQKYDDNEPAPPVCFSDNGTGPSVNSLEPQAPTCAVCPWNERGSETTFTGKPTTACTKKKKLACIIPGDPAVNVYELQVPIASLSMLRQYHDWISQQSVPGLDRQLDVSDVITRLGWSEQKNFQLTFAPVGWTDARSVQVIEYVDANKLMDVPLGRNDVAMDPEKVQASLAGRPVAAALPAPAAQAPPQQFTLPPPLQAMAGPAGFVPPPPLASQPAPYQNGAQQAARPPLHPSGIPSPMVNLEQRTTPRRTRGPNRSNTVAPSSQQPAPAPPMQHSEQFAASQNAPQWATPQPIPGPQQNRPVGVSPALSAPYGGALQGNGDPYQQFASSPQPQPSPAGFAAQPQVFASGDPGPIPQFLQRAPGPRQDAPPPAQTSSGFMMPPPPPPGIQSALDAAMKLPTV